MSVSESDYLSVHKSPLNKSTSKQLYSFSKAARFSPPKQS